MDLALSLKENRMLATVAGYEFDVDRGPDWLWIRIRSLGAGSVARRLVGGGA